MLPSWFIIVAVVVRLSSGANYGWAVIKGKAKPNPISWFFWGIAPMIAFVAQLYEGVGATSWITFAIGFGPMMVFFISLEKNWSKSHLSATIFCATLAATGLILWQITNDPVLAIIFSILADIFGGIPTLIKPWRTPSSEYALPYFLSMVAMIITLLSINNWSFATYSFPVYIFLINLIIFSLVKFEIGQKYLVR